MDGKKIKILIVDDDNPTRQMYVEIFQNANFDVLEAKDGVEGLDIATRENPEVIFTGVIMPRMDGFSLMEALKKNIATANIPVVISSHMGREEDQQRARSLGARDFVVLGMTSPIQVVKRVEALFASEGNYRVKFDAQAMDAQKLLENLGVANSGRCAQCNEQLAFDLKIVDMKEKRMEAKIACPNCGWMLG